MAIVKKATPAGVRVPGQGKAVKAASDEYRLPTTRSQPLPNLMDYAILLFGAKKIGKTTLVSLMPDTLFLMTEPGAKGLSVYQSAITSWPQFKQAVKAIMRDTRFKAVCVDTVDLAFKMCETYVCQKLGIDHPSDEDWGKGYGAVRDEFTREMQKLLSCGKGVTFISHSTEREIKTRSGRKYDRVQPTMPNQARDIIEGFVDIWAYYDYDGDRRVLTIRGDDHIMAGCRLQQHFMYNGREVPAIDMGITPAEGYGNFIACFNNQYRPRPKATGEEPTPAPTTRVTVRKRTV